MGYPVSTLVLRSSKIFCTWLATIRANHPLLLLARLAQIVSFRS
jgi:hypothetical protein